MVDLAMLFRWCSRRLARRNPAVAISCYRFQVGDRVLCRTSPDDWSLGTIVKLNYRDPTWPSGTTVPYQVRVASGQLAGELIYVPMDMEALCRPYAAPWWEPVLRKLPAEDPAPAELRAACARAGGNVNQRDHAGTAALSEAVRLCWPGGVRELVGMSADVNVVSCKRVHPLHLAAQLGAPFAAGITQILLGAKADPNCQDLDPDFDPEFTSATFGDHPEHRTPLHYCCLEDDVAAMKVLIEGRATVDVQDGQRKTPLHLAIEGDKAGAFDLLVQHGADVHLSNLETGMKNTPLMCAVHAGSHVWVERLLQAKSDVNRQGNNGMSALHLAARRGDATAAQAILSARADVAQRSTCGTAAELARKNGGVELLRLLGESVGEGPPAGGTCKVTSVSSLDAYQRAALFMD